MKSIDASPILEGSLYQGSAPPIGDKLRRAGFHAVVLCAREVQPIGFDSSIHVIRAPFDDVVDPAPSDLKRAAAAAKRVAQLVRIGYCVLVTCAMGLNRSGLVSALAMREITGKSGTSCMLHVRSKRQGALSNRTFRALLAMLPPKT